MAKYTGRKSIADNGFMSSVFVLSLSTVIVKIIGLACKIPMISVLGAEGMGYFNSAYEIYALLCVIATAGLPVALSILISGAREKNDSLGVKEAWRASVLIFLILGALGTIILLGFAKPISGVIGNTNASYSLVAIAPALLFVCLSSAVRGYFQGLGNMTPTAISQLIEALGKLILGVLFAKIALSSGEDISVASAYAVFGLTLGTALSTVYLLSLKLKDRRVSKTTAYKSSGKKRDTVKTLLRIAFPITVSSAVLSITRMIDMSLILRRLSDIGVNASSANEIYGSYTTLALPVFSLLPSLITPIALSLVPQLSAAIEKQSMIEQKKVFSDSLRLTVLFAMPASMAISLYARSILSVLFIGQSEAIDISAPLLSILGASVLFSCIITTTNAILQSYRKTVLPIISMLIGAFVKIISAYFLIGNPTVGVMGAPISTFLCNVAIVGINLFFVFKLLGEDCGIFKILGGSFVSSVASIALSFSAYLPIFSLLENDLLAFCVAVAVAVPAYFAFSALTRTVTKDDLALLPFIKLNKEKTSS